MKNNRRLKLIKHPVARKLTLAILATLIILSVSLVATELIMANKMNSQDKQAIRSSGDSLSLMTASLDKNLSDVKATSTEKVSSINDFTKKLDGTLTCSSSKIVYKNLLTDSDKCQKLKTALGDIKQDADLIIQLISDQEKISLIVASVDDNQSVAKASEAWSTASTKLNELQVSSAAEGMKADVAKGISDYAAAWAQLSAADTAQDSAAFTKAKAALLNNHKALVASSSSVSKPLDELASQINTKINDFISQTNTP